MKRYYNQGEKWYRRRWTAMDIILATGGALFLAFLACGMAYSFATYNPDPTGAKREAEIQRLIKQKEREEWIKDYEARHPL